ncbi:MAG: type I DNA topoisomerase [Desulfobacterales bacterium]|nr:type I DNA topoisomerase [Desulfobacterales bacterium]
MDKPLIIVESPTKVKTIQKYMGSDYNVAATLGHIKDLPQKALGVDIENEFEPDYQIIPGKQKIVKALKKAAGDAKDIYLAPDPDREGEAIAWHTAGSLKAKGRTFHRVLFHELTKKAISEAMAKPIELNKDKYEAQQARRILDRLVGYQISPLLWGKVKRGLSAGRVQSVAVRIICERERKIYAFVPNEYWSITVYFEVNSKQFTAKLTKKNNENISLSNEKEVNQILEELKGKDLIVEKIVRKTNKKNPNPPFTTSKLQQDAIRRLKFSAKKTMVVAQQLYEGVDLGSDGSVGLITYMRTDSTRVSKEALDETQKFITEKFGEDYSLKEHRTFKNQKKVQDAHEAIRPTSVYYKPEDVAKFLTEDQIALYRLIWQRFVASQMKQALIETVSVSIKASEYLFSASGSTILFPGFMTLYISSDDEEEKEDTLPKLSENMILRPNKYDPKQHFTSPPPRFSEASLVKELEENGIGRPSTYATILSTIREKGYVEVSKGYFKPSELGFIVNDLLVENFPEVLDVEFTAKMETDLDYIESSKLNCAKVLSRFYNKFKKNLDIASKEMLSIRGVGTSTGIICPECNLPVNIKFGKNGPFLACSGYPKCNYTRNYTRDEKGNIIPVEPLEPQVSDKICEKCESPMMIKRGRFGQFLACSKYPECKNTKSLLPQSENTGVKCPEKDCTGEIVSKRSKRGRVFYGCNRYPDCKFALWQKPVNISCPSCSAKFLVEKSTKKEGKFLFCVVKECGFKEILKVEEN